MKLILIFVLFFSSFGCNNVDIKKNYSFDEKLYTCSKCGSILYNSKDFLYENESSKDFKISFSEKVTYDLNSLDKKNKSPLFCKICNKKLGNFIKGDSTNNQERHCVDKNSIILKKIMK